MRHKFLKTLLCISICCLSHHLLQAQSYGCTDSLALNFDPFAQLNNGACVYPISSITLPSATALPQAVEEISGQIFDNGHLWAHNDAGNSPTLFSIDTGNGSIKRRIHIANYPNVDWEAITADNYYLYIGDIGNNNGTRTDLRVLKIAKTDLYKNPNKPIDTVNVVQVLPFRYGRQTSFSSSSNHNWDSEAMVFYKDTIHIFSKNRGNLSTYHYKLPAYTSNSSPYVLYPTDSFNVGVQITDASISQHGVLALVGYNTAGLTAVSMWLFSEYRNTRFFKSSRRKVDLSSVLTYGQVEGICFTNHARGFISNEKVTQGPFVVNNTLRRFDISQLVMYKYRKPTPIPIIGLPFAQLEHGEGAPWFHYSSGTFTNNSINQVSNTVWKLTTKDNINATPVQSQIIQDNITGPFPYTIDSFPCILQMNAGNLIGSDSTSIQLKYTISGNKGYRHHPFTLPIKVFPNPARDMIMCETVPEIYPIQISIFDMWQRQVLQKSLLNNTFIDIGSLKPGIYNLSVHYAEGFHSFRFLKE
jgi:hypothetical protein